MWWGFGPRAAALHRLYRVAALRSRSFVNHPSSSREPAPSRWTDAAVPPAGSITPTPVANVLADDLAVRSYQQALHSAAPGMWSSGLHLGAEQVAWAAGPGAPEPAVTLCLPLGGAHTARQFCRGTIPTPLELENAIAAVEDEVHIAHCQLQGLLPPGQVWAPWSADVALHDLATLAGVPPGPHRVLTLDAMERLFNRLAAVSAGRPAAQEGLPDDPAFAGTLLVLRELMHHLPFASLVLVEAPPGHEVSPSG